MKNSVFKKPKLKAQGGRNPFDISQHRVWHSPFGAILPCFCKRVKPDDYLEISVESQTICDKIVRPAFIRLKEHFNFYFVPYNMLWNPFDNLVTGQDNYYSQAIEYFQDQSKVPNQVPVIDKSCLASALAEMSTRKDIHGYNKLYSSLRLLDLLGYGNFYPLCAALEAGGGRVEQSDVLSALGDYEKVNLFGLLAYQKVYYDYFRNPKYESNNTTAFNIDDFQAQVITEFSEDRYDDIFSMHYAWAKKDYFTDVQPSVLPSSSDIGFSGLTPNSPMPVGGSLWQVFGVPGSSEGSVVANVGEVTGGPATQVDGNFVGDNFSNSMSYDNVTALRFAFAYDKLLRRMREAGGTFDAQMLAQFGITPYDARHGKCHWIGGQTNRLNASDVTNVAENLGFLGGLLNCYNPARNTFKFHAYDHGLVIGVYNTSLDFDYPSYGIDRDNLARYRFDWFNGVYENLGLQPIFRQELISIKLDNPLPGVERWDNTKIQINQSDNGKNLRDVIGYSRRYLEYKTNIDRVYGLFDFGSSDAERTAWVTQFYPFVGANAKNTGAMNIALMTFTPEMFDQLVKVEYDGEWDTDPFNHNTYIHCKKISNMSVLGESF